MSEMQSGSEMGAVEAEYGAGMKPRIAAFFLVGVFMGLIALGVSQSDQAPLLLGLVALVTAALMAFIQFVFGAVRVRIYQGGLESKGRFRTKRIAWDNLQKYQLQIIDSTMLAGAAGGLAGVLVASLISKVRKSKSVPPNAVWIYGSDGTKIILSASVKGYASLLDTLLPSLDERLFPAVKTTYESGALVDFGKQLTLQRGSGITVSGLFGKKNVLPLGQAASAQIERAAFVIRHGETKAVWQSLQAATVMNPGVLQKFVDGNVMKQVDDEVPLVWSN
jgi:hypothetical protein